MSFEPASLTLRRLRVYKSTRLRVAVAWATLLLRGLTTKDKWQKSKRYRVYRKAVSYEPASLTLRRLRVYKSTRLRVADALGFAVERVERGIESIEGIESLLKP